MVKRPGTAVTIKEPTLIQIEAYYNRVDEGGKPLTTEYTPKPPAATALEELIIKDAAKLGLRHVEVRILQESDGTPKVFEPWF